MSQEQAQHFHQLSEEERQKLLRIMKEDDNVLAQIMAAGESGDILAAEAFIAYQQLVKVEWNEDGSAQSITRHGSTDLQE